MTEIISPIPSRLKNVAVGGHVAGADQIIDDQLNKDQETINAEVAEALGEGGTVDEKIAAALEDVAFIDDSSSSSAVVPSFDPESQTVHVTAQTLSESQKQQVRENIGLGDVDAKINEAVASEASQRAAAVSGVQSSVNAEATRAQAAEAALQNNIEALTQSSIEVVANHTQVQNPDATTIYREFGESSYADWMYQNNTWQKMAEYNNAIDDVPTDGSDNLVKSGGVFNFAKNYKGVLAASTDNIDVIYSESTYLLNTTLVSGTLPSGITTYAMLTTYGDGNFTYQILTEVYTSATCRTWIRSRYDTNTYLAWVEASWNNLDNGIITSSDNINTLSKSGGYVIPTGITIPGTFPNDYDYSVIGNLFVQANSLNLWSQTLFNGGNCWVRNYNTSWVRLLNSNVPILYNDENIDSLKMFGTYLLNTTLVSGTLPFNISTYAILNIYGLDNFCIQTLTQCTQSQEPITWIRSYNNSWTPWSFLTNNSVPIDPSQPLYGKKIVFFGDSVTEGGAAGPQGQINNYPQFVAARTGATITNVGIGGTQMANHVAAPDYNPFSFCNLVTAITTNTWTTQDEKAPVIGKTTQLAALKALDLSTYDYCVISYGQNDRSNGVAVGNSDSVDNDEFYGAMNNSINALLTSYPNLHIIMVAPYNRVDAPLSNPMLPFVNAVVEEAEKWAMPAINLYKISGINAKTVSTYLEDGLHPKLNSKYGYEFFGNLIAAQMLSFV